LDNAAVTRLDERMTEQEEAVMTDRVGEMFQHGTCYERGRLSGGVLDWANRPETYKRYPDAPLITLDAPAVRGGLALNEALATRRSVRKYAPRRLTAAHLSQILWSSQGITRPERNIALRTAPSAGGLFPIETYVLAHAVHGIPQGLYHYAIEPHALEQLQLGDLRLQAGQAALDQGMASDADLVLIWTAVFARSVWKYKQRAYRYIYLDAGHVAQNTALAAVSLGLGSCQIAALYDDEVNALLGIDGESESVVYMTSIGAPA
jgi:SagB-type dehydrogenase family enzyme